MKFLESKITVFIVTYNRGEYLNHAITRIVDETKIQARTFTGREFLEKHINI